jgi:hypothetical protein
MILAPAFVEREIEPFHMRGVDAVVRPGADEAAGKTVC